MTSDKQITESRAPEFGGQCAFAVSTGKKGVAGREKYFAIENGRKYLFSNPVAKLLWKILPNRRRKAEECWNKQSVA